MDPPAPGRGGKARGGRELGLKTTSAHAPAPPPSSASRTPPVPLPPPPVSATSSPNPTPSAADPSLGGPTSSPAAPSSSPGAMASSPAAPSSTVPPMPSQGPGWGAIPPNFAAFHGNLRGSNSWIYPPGGFLNMMHQPHYPPQSQGENFHLVGQNMAFNPISPPQPANSCGIPSPQGTEQGLEQDTSSNKTVKQRCLRYWTHEEEERLASSWLEISKDPIHGNDKKGDTFWKEITNEFTRKGNGKRTRETNQLKVHWSRLKSAIGDWNDYWTKVTQMHTSGYSDDMLEEEAQKLYANRHGKNFTLIHWWKILKDEPKWCAQFETEKDKSEIGDIPEAQKRPIGRDAAKAERSGRRKKENVKDGIVILGDNIEKIIKVEEDRKMERDKVQEAQIQISNANLKAAKEHKEAKMFEVYNSLLNQDTRNMSEDQKANRDRAISKLEAKLFSD